MSRVPLTRRQKDALDAIKQFIGANDLGPTLEELAEALGINRVTAIEHVRELKRKGWILADRYQSRSIRIRDDVPDQVEVPGAIQLLGTVAAGQPIEAVEAPESISLNEIFPTAAGLYALRVKGNSMIDDQICDGDLVLVRPQKTANDGETVVALIDGNEATVKRFRRVGAQIRLEPRNAALKPMTFDAPRVQIRGIVVGLIRTTRGH